MHLSRVGISIALIGLSATTAHAECFSLSAKYVMDDRDVELVFGGRVSQVIQTGELAYRATFAVDRVWKGSVPKRIDIYVWELAPEMPDRFAKERSYVVLAKRLTDPATKRAVGLSGSEGVAYTPNSCSGALQPDIGEQLGPGRPPTDKQGGS